MELNHEQQALVAGHLDVVANILKYTIRANETVQGLGYDDLYQEGCVALCRAALTFNGSAQFKTYAQTVVKNRLIDHCRSVLRQYARTVPMEEQEFPVSGDLPLRPDTLAALARAKPQYSGVALRGIEAMELKLKGYSGAEIAALYNAKPNEVGAWISRARQKLLRDTEFLAAIC